MGVRLLEILTQKIESDQKNREKNLNAVSNVKIFAKTTRLEGIRKVVSICDKHLIHVGNI